MTTNHNEPGDRAFAGTGGKATAGYGGRAGVGDGGTAVAGAKGLASAGAGGTAEVGPEGAARAGLGGTLKFATWDDWADGVLVTVAVDGADILPDTYYRLDEAGRVVPA